MSDVIKGFLVEEFLEEAKEDTDQALVNAEKEYERLFGDASVVPEIYVLSNELRIRGAAVVFYTDVLKGFAEEMNSDLLLLPSSIHEWLILTEPPAGDIGTLKRMVMEANRNVVRAEEILSENVYRYTRRDNRMTIAN
jgi:hypothetical protein